MTGMAFRRPYPGRHRRAQPVLETIGLDPCETGVGKRLDIEGLRALAILAVVVYHSALGLLPGGFVGVDLFFVVSGFLITGQIWREVATTGRLRLARFWSRRAKRLLPAAMVVLGFAAVLTVTVLPITLRRAFGIDIVTAAAYVVNWRLASRESQYAAEGLGLSPVQHYWSLAVEEQFYIIWPLLVALVVLVLARRARHHRAALAVGVGVIAAASLVWSVYYTGADQARAFYVTPTRLWELAVGALAALAVPLAARLGRRWRDVLAVGGLAALVWSAAAARESVGWPGFAALAPCLGTAALILAGVGGASAATGPAHLLGRPLAAKPMVWLGGLSYSWYLWHWPVLLLARAVRPELTWWESLVWGLGSLVPAYATHRLVENPLRFAAPFQLPGNALAMGAACTAVSLVLGLGAWHWNELTHVRPGGTPGAATGPVPSAARSPGPRPASGALDPSAPGTEADPFRDWPAILAAKSYPVIMPDPLDAYNDAPSYSFTECRTDYAESVPEPCLSGDPAGETTLVMVGDSYMGMWESAVDTVAKRNGVKVVGYFKTSCPLTTAAMDGRLDGSEVYETCPAWGRAVTDRIVELKPDLVLTTQWTHRALSKPDDPSSPPATEPMTDGVAPLWKKVRDAGVPIAVLGRNPARPFDEPSVYECVAQNPDDLPACAFEPDLATAEWQQDMVRRFGEGVSYFDLNSLICAPESCPAVIDGVLVYRASTHLTRTFVDTLAGPLEARLLPLLPPD
jgi:peptidoglycan/LPS O-acetylase OafA/YrhL